MDGDRLRRKGERSPLLRTDFCLCDMQCMPAHLSWECGPAEAAGLVLVALVDLLLHLAALGALHPDLRQTDCDQTRWSCDACGRPARCTRWASSATTTLREVRGVGAVGKGEPSATTPNSANQRL
jgi:hypothetical protein